MGIRFLCPNGHKLHVKANLAGRKGACPTCGAKVIIPEESAPVQAAEAGAAVAEPQAAAPGWFVRGEDDEQYGPVSDAGLAEWVEDGRVGHDTWVWREGWPDWRQASDALPEHFPLRSTAPPPPPLRAAADPPPAVEDHEPPETAFALPPEDEEDGEYVADFSLSSDGAEAIPRVRKPVGPRQLKAGTLWAVLLLSVLAVALGGLLIWILMSRSQT
jgi:hypothetical protein